MKLNRAFFVLLCPNTGEVQCWFNTKKQFTVYYFKKVLIFSCNAINLTYQDIKTTPNRGVNSKPKEGEKLNKNST